MMPVSGMCVMWLMEGVLHMQDRMTKLPELIAAAKCVIDNVDSDALLSYFGLKTDVRPGASTIKVSVPPFLFLPSLFAVCMMIDG